MSFYSGAPGPGGNAPVNDGGYPMGTVSGGPSDMSMMSANGNSDLMTSMDMDMSLSMDMGMDLTGAEMETSFQQLQQPQQAQIMQQMHQMHQAQEEQQAQQAHQAHQAQQAQQSTQSFDQPNLMAGTVADNAPSSEAPTESNNVAGAGPLPTGFGMPPPNGTSTLTEFTKRRNWSQRVIEEIRDFLHILTPDGRILYASPSCKTLTGHQPQALVGKFIIEFVHPDDSSIFLREFNESIASTNRLRFFYRFKQQDGTYTIFECDGHPHFSSDASAPSYDSNGMQSNLCRGFFMMSRPYPTKNAALLDSFLGHKIENEKLMKRIEELKREEMEDNVQQDQLGRDSPSSVTKSVASDPRPSGSRVSADSDPKPDYQGMPPPAKPTVSNVALTARNLDSAQSAQRPDSIADKMSRYEANSTHLESIELLTGLDYREGERSRGISTGDQSPALIRGDAGIDILADRDRDGKGKEKKKPKTDDEYVCSDCGTLDSPEWRKGPRGPKTLCNACGLRWAKKEKKRDDGKDHSPHTGGLTPAGSSMTPGSGVTMMSGHGVPSLMRNASSNSG